MAKLNDAETNMNKENLHQELERLHAELEQLDSLDDSDSEKLSLLAQDIRRILDYRGTDERHYQSLVERVRDVVTELEASHPKTTLLMRQVLDQIAYLGI
ncbi:MAG TPA: DUF4404 family protein [Pyrinomonadaceae bacterium]|jgi:hypothetical protein|nr:DUF4404 family protein [Pyrinomonadaceae bacterium]